MRQHGTRAKYVHEHCHCEQCRAANLAYYHRWNRRRLAVLYGAAEPPLVDAAETREHLAFLSLCGVGLRQVHRLTGVSRSSLWKIRRGISERVTAQTADLVLSITYDQRAGGRWGREHG